MIAVTGATGLVGRVLLFDLLKDNQKVRAFFRGSSNLEAVKDAFFEYHEGTEALWSQIEWVEVDFSDLDSLKTGALGVKHIYHCAGEVSFDPKREESLYQTNSKGTENLLYALEGSSVESLLHVSTIAVLDGLNSEGEVDESCDFNPKLAHSPYAISKHIAELEVMRAGAEGLRVVMVNPGIILGSGCWNQSSGALYSKYKNLSLVPNGLSAYVDVRDVSRACQLLMAAEPKKSRYVLVSENKSNLWVANKIRGAFGRSKAKVLPTAFLKVGYGLNVLLGWLIPPLRWLSKPNISALSSKDKVSSAQLIEEFNFEFIPIEKSLEYHLTHFKNKSKS